MTMRRSLIMLAAAATAFHFAASVASAQSKSPFDPRLMRERSDSFAIVVQGAPRGFMKESITARPGGFRLTSQQALGTMMSQETQVDFTGSLEMQEVRQSGTARGMEMKIGVAYASGRATGTATTPGPQGMKSITVDAAFPAGAVDDNVLMSLLPTLELTPGATHAVPVFASGKGTLATMTLTVGARETVTVLAGSFEVHPVSLTGGDVPVTFFVSAAAPRRVVKMTMPGSPLSFELARP
ncbi:MAG: hypothetical protein IPP20_09560 [Gemmatimonadetes bacterium]|nr:hypothetical protein [Gemmatimonadota bacterium]